MTTALRLAALLTLTLALAGCDNGTANTGPATTGPTPTPPAVTR